MTLSVEPVAANLTLKDAARRLGVSPHTLRSWAVYQHRLPFFRVGRRLLFAPADLEAFLALHRVAAREEPQNGAGRGVGMCTRIGIPYVAPRVPGGPSDHCYRPSGALDLPGP
jgi:excisionase family DNA binding protein